MEVGGSGAGGRREILFSTWKCVNGMLPAFPSCARSWDGGREWRETSVQKRGRNMFQFSPFHPEMLSTVV